MTVISEVTPPCPLFQPCKLFAVYSPPEVRNQLCSAWLSAEFKAQQLGGVKEWELGPTGLAMEITIPGNVNGSWHLPLVHIGIAELVDQ